MNRLNELEIEYIKKQHEIHCKIYDLEIYLLRAKLDACGDSTSDTLSSQSGI